MVPLSIHPSSSFHCFLSCLFTTLTWQVRSQNLNTLIAANPGGNVADIVGAASFKDCYNDHWLALATKFFPFNFNK